VLTENLNSDNDRGIASLRRIGGNMASLLSSNVVNKATTFALYALVARYLSAFEFGQMSLALSYFFLFQVFALAGLELQITRAVANDKAATGKYFVNGSAVVFVFSILSMIIQLTFIWALNYSKETTTVILLLSLGLLPFTLSTVCQAIFKAWERMRYIAYANIPVSVAKVIFALLLLSHGFGLYSLIILLLISHIVTMGVQWWLMFRYISKPSLHIDAHLMVSIVKSASTFLGIEVILAVMGSFSNILLSKLTSETEVGYYSAAYQLMVPIQIFYQSVVSSIFPLMCRKFNLDTSSLKRITEYLAELLLAVAIPSTIGLFFFSDFVLQLIYGNGLLPATNVLRVGIWTLIPTALSFALGQALYASNREKITLRIIIIDLVVSVVFNLILISRFGLIGAPIASLLIRTVDFFQHYVSISRRLFTISIRRIATNSVVASLCLIAYLSMWRHQLNFLVMITAGMVYVSILVLLMIWSNGGYRRLRSQVKAWYAEQA
jgi:O-antigen/teichoic acid export membrane protein